MTLEPAPARMSPVSADERLKLSSPAPPRSSAASATVETSNVSASVPPVSVSKPVKLRVNPPVEYLGVPSSSQVLIPSRPVKLPTGWPVNVSIPEKPPAMSGSVPLKPFKPGTAVKITWLIDVPCNVSVPNWPLTAPVGDSGASKSKMSSPSPPLKLKLLTNVTLNVSTNVPPCRVAKPLKFKTAAAAFVYVGEPSNNQVLMTFCPVNVPRFPMMVAIPAKPEVMFASSPENSPFPVEPVSVTASTALPRRMSTSVAAPSPLIEPVKVTPASISNVSVASPPSKLNVLFPSMLKTSPELPPCSVPKPTMANAPASPPSV